MQQPLRTTPELMRLLRALQAEPDEWRLGEELVREAGLRAAVVYAMLGRLQSQGLVETQPEAQASKGRPPRKLYRLTEAGLEATEAAPRSYQAQWSSKARRKQQRRGG